MLIFAVMAASVDAALIPWTATLGPDNEVPVVTGSDGFGTASGTVDSDSGLLTWSLEWADLTGDAVGAHFHGPATTSANAGVVVNIGGISGLTSPATGFTTISGSQVSELLAELWYINVHTQVNPAGEIRGQVIPEPVAISAPATLPLLLGGVLLLTLRRMIKRKPAVDAD
jgi:hypothetical protein